MVATKNSTAKTAKTTKTATKAAEGKAPEKENAQTQAAENPEQITQPQAAENTTAESGSTVEPQPSQPSPGSEEKSPAAGGGEDDDTQHPQAQSEIQASPDPDAPKEAEDVKRIAVKAMTPRFRRAGFEFSPRERILDVRKLTEEQLNAILEEPRLAVRPVGQED